MHLRNLKELYFHEVRDLYAAEKQLIDALPKLARAASSSKLREAFESHLNETRKQKERLDQIFKRHGLKPDAQVCEAMYGLIAEGGELIATSGGFDSAVLDAALIGAAQKIEHFEIAAYGTARAHANQLGYDDDVRLLQETLDEESHTNEALNKLAISGINARAAS